MLLSPVTPGLSAKILAELGLEGPGESHMAPAWLTHHAASTGISGLSWKDTAWRWDVILGLGSKIDNDRHLGYSRII